MSSSKTAEGLKMAPMRSMSDFILDTKRYLPPPFNDLKRFNNRISSNLLYYQTNYFVVGVSIFTMFLLFGFNKIFAGTIGSATTGFVVLFILDRIPQMSSLRAQYPVAMFGLGVVNLLVLYSTFRSILFFALSLLVPILTWLVHAAMRSRGLKNKISNKMEQIGGQVYTNTPMGIVLSTLGLEAKDFDE